MKIDNPPKLAPLARKGREGWRGGGGKCGERKGKEYSLLFSVGKNREITEMSEAEGGGGNGRIGRRRGGDELIWEMANAGKEEEG
jgi:hypothetical protein